MNPCTKLSFFEVPDVLNNCLTYLEPQEKIVAMRVCQMFHEIIKQMIYTTCMVYEPSTYLPPYETTTSLVGHEVRRSCSLRYKFWFRLYKYIMKQVDFASPERTPAALLTTLKRCQRTYTTLTSLNLDRIDGLHIDIDCLREINELFNGQLQSLSIRSFFQIDKILSVCTNLQMLRLTCFYMDMASAENMLPHSYKLVDYTLSTVACRQDRTKCTCTPLFEAVIIRSSFYKQTSIPYSH